MKFTFKMRGGNVSHESVVCSTALLLTVEKNMFSHVERIEMLSSRQSQDDRYQFTFVRVKEDEKRLRGSHLLFVFLFFCFCQLHWHYSWYCQDYTCPVVHGMFSHQTNS